MSAAWTTTPAAPRSANRRPVVRGWVSALLDSSRAAAPLARHRRDSARPAQPPPSTEHLSLALVTDVNSNVEHMTTTDEMGRLALGHRPRALCGQTVTAAPLVAPPGRRCQVCKRVVTDRR